MYAVEFKNVSKNIRKDRILYNLNFGIRDNTIFGLVGANGAGKTTLLKLILGLYRTNNGEIYIDGRKVNNNAYMALNDIGAVVDSPGLYKYLSGWRNLEFFNLLGKNVSKTKILEIVDFLNIRSYIHRPVSTYSLGMKQRLALAVALISYPKLLILDEPLNGLDPKGISDLRKILLYLKCKYKMTIVISSHILSELESVCDEVAFIEDNCVSKIVDVKNSESSLEDLYFEGSKDEKISTL